MSTIRWVGGAEKKAKVVNYTFAGTWVIGETLTFTIGVKQWTYALTSATIATFLPLLVTAYNALTATDYQEMAELTASSTSPDLNLTADAAGKPFACTISTNSAAGTIEGVAAPNSSSAGTTTTANGGPQSLASVKNYSGGALPINGDTLIFDYSDDEILYDLDALSAVTLTVLRIYATFTGKIGMPKNNADGTEYPEYRADYFQVGATTAYIGEGDGDGSSRLKIAFGAVQTTCNIFQSAQGDQDDLGAILITGTHASNVFNVTKGDVDIAPFGGESATVLTLNQSFETDVAGDANVYLGPGVTLGTVSKVGGKLEINSAVGTALTNENGDCTINGTGAVAQLTIRGGVVTLNTTGTVGGNTIVANGLLDLDQDKRAKTITNPIDCYGLGRVRDTNKVWAALIVDYNEMDVGDLGRNVRITRGAVA